jgi:hypothetical protein
MKKRKVVVKKRKNPVQIITIKKKRYYQARDSKGHILATKQVKGSKMTVKQANDVFKKYQSLDRGVYASRRRLGDNSKTVLRTKITSVSIKERKSESGVKLKPMTKGVTMYVCQGTFRRKEIATTSDKLGTGEAVTRNDAVKQARTRFWKKIGYIIENKNLPGSDGDEDLGLENISSVSNYKEGWVNYV